MKYAHKVKMGWKKPLEEEEDGRVEDVLHHWKCGGLQASTDEIIRATVIVLDCWAAFKQPGNWEKSRYWAAIRSSKVRRDLARGLDYQLWEASGWRYQWRQEIPVRAVKARIWELSREIDMLESVEEALECIGWFVENLVVEKKGHEEENLLWREWEAERRLDWAKDSLEMDAWEGWAEEALRKEFEDLNAVMPIDGVTSGLEVDRLSPGRYGAWVLAPGSGMETCPATPEGTFSDSLYGAWAFGLDAHGEVLAGSLSSYRSKPLFALKTASAVGEATDYGVQVGARRLTSVMRELIEGGDPKVVILEESKYPGLKFFWKKVLAWLEGADGPWGQSRWWATRVARRVITMIEKREVISPSWYSSTRYRGWPGNKISVEAVAAFHKWKACMRRLANACDWEDWWDK